MKTGFVRFFSAFFCGREVTSPGSDRQLNNAERDVGTAEFLGSEDSKTEQQGVRGETDDHVRAMLWNN
jgi:hypothetical protein